MDHVLKYRKRRIQRLEKRFGEYHGPARFDADDDSEGSNNRPSQGGGGHGNTKIPFGLCQREGIQIGQDWTPKDAWDALAGKGYSASDVYTELKKTGKVPEKAKEPEKPKKTPAELKKMSKTVSDLKKNMKKLDKLEKELSIVSKDLENAEKTQKYYEDYVQESKDRGQTWIADQFAGYLEDTKKDVERARQKKSEVEQKMASHLSKEEYKKKYNEAVDELLSGSPNTERVHNYRTLEEESSDVRKKLAVAQEKVEKAKFGIEYYNKLIQRARNNGDERTASFYENGGLAANKKLLALNQQYVEEFSKQVKDFDGRMEKERGDASDKDWKQIYDLTIERDTVEEGTYDNDILGDVSKSLKGRNVKYINPVKYAKTPSEEKIIERLCGPDKTSGSCASLAFAYIFNKAGYKIFDFRGGDSRTFFSYECDDIIKAIGGSVSLSRDGFTEAKKALEGVEEGKEYYFASAKHAAAIRKKNGKLEYLELQDSPGGWEELTDNALKTRFKAKIGGERYQYTCLIEGDKVASSKDLLSLMGYINTDEDKQKKGFGGGIK